MKDQREAMDIRQRRRVIGIAKQILSHEEVERFERIGFKDLGFGFDKFGFEKEAGLLAYIFARLLHMYYFRVKSDGIENIPGSGPAILVANHSGMLPIDAAMISVDVFRNSNPPRVPRSITDFFAFDFPFLGTILTRLGQVPGSRRNFEELLNEGELVLVCPEGTIGIGKHFSERYKIKPFRVGHMEMALKFRVPIIPVALVGAEEQSPILYNIKSIAKLLHVPYFPVTPTFPWLGPLGLLPYPVKYHITYGEPIHFYRDYPPETVEHVDTVNQLTEEVRLKLQTMVDRTVELRKGVFL